jgi:hypothetical protein
VCVCFVEFAISTASDADALKDKQLVMKATLQSERETETATEIETGNQQAADGNANGYTDGGSRSVDI